MIWEEVYANQLTTDLFLVPDFEIYSTLAQFDQRKENKPVCFRSSATNLTDYLWFVDRQLVTTALDNFRIQVVEETFIKSGRGTHWLVVRTADTPLYSVLGSQLEL